MNGYDGQRFPKIRRSVDFAGLSCHGRAAVTAATIHFRIHQFSSRMKRINASSYKKDKLYPGIVKVVTEILETEKVVTPVEVLIRQHRITRKQYEDWRHGRIPCLERVCIGNLSKLNRLLRVLEQHCLASGMKPSQTVYRKWGKGSKWIVLQFSRSGDPGLEAAYSRHYVMGELAAPSAGEIRRNTIRENDRRVNGTGISGDSSPLRSK